jgi:hypothetical protein
MALTNIAGLINCPDCKTLCIGVKQKVSDFTNLIGLEQYCAINIKCPNTGCYEHGSISAISNHVQQCNQCPSKTIMCNFCHEMTLMDNIQYHILNECKSLPCSTCIRRVSAKDYYTHMENHKNEQTYISNIRTYLDELENDPVKRGLATKDFKLSIVPYIA